MYIILFSGLFSRWFLYYCAAEGGIRLVYNTHTHTCHPSSGHQPVMALTHQWLKPTGPYQISHFWRIISCKIWRDDCALRYFRHSNIILYWLWKPFRRDSGPIVFNYRSHYCSPHCYFIPDNELHDSYTCYFLFEITVVICYYFRKFSTEKLLQQIPTYLI